MEGKATFTLTEAKTGRIVKQFTEHNLVTDAVKRILEPPLYTLLHNFSYSKFLSGVTPVSRLFSGVMLLGNNLVEDKSNVVMSKDCIPVATAGGAYAGTNVRRGSLNENESYATENGYHFTWDFGTDKANGTIKCVALTSRQFGDTGLSSDEDSGNFVLNAQNILNGTGLDIGMMYANGQFIATLEDRTHYYFKNNQNTVTFYKYRYADPAKFGLNDVTGLTWATPVFSTTVTLPIEKGLGRKTFFDPSRKILYFFSYERSDGTKYYTNYCGVSMTDFTVVETGKQTVYNHSYIRAFGIYDGKFYVLFDDCTDVFVLGSDTSLASYSFNGWNGNARLFVHNDIVMGFNGNDRVAMYMNDTFYSFRSATYYMPLYSCDIKPPYYPASMHDNDNMWNSGVSQNPYLCVSGDYFATINNLSEPLEKTSEHTLKITYDITN